MERMDVERPRRTSPARGVALIATAAVVGLFVLRNGFESPMSGSDDLPVAEQSSDTTAPAAGGEGEGGTATTATTAAPAARPPAEVTVIVANTTGIAGAAGGVTDRLAGEGYQTVEPTNTEPALELSQVQFAPGFELEAAAVAAFLQAPADSVMPLADPAPVDPAGAQVVVLLGSNLAPG